jgi:hypothetical protein
VLNTALPAARKIRVLLGEDNGGAANSDVQNAGRAEALPIGGSSAGDVGLPMLLAVLALSGVSAGLARTWVLRRAVVA